MGELEVMEMVVLLVLAEEVVVEVVDEVVLVEAVVALEEVIKMLNLSCICANLVINDQE